MDMNIGLVRERIKQKMMSHQEIMKELHIHNAEDFSKMTDAQLEALISPKMMGMLSLTKDEIKMPKKMM